MLQQAFLMKKIIIVSLMKRLLRIFTDLQISGLIEDSWILISASAFKLLQYLSEDMLPLENSIVWNRKCHLIIMKIILASWAP